MIEIAIRLTKYHFIDINSWKNLDLFHIDDQPKKGQYRALYDILNCCLTPGGMRTLKSCLLQPCTDPAVINARLDAVQELVMNQGVYKFCLLKCVLTEKQSSLVSMQLAAIQIFLSVFYFSNKSKGGENSEGERLLDIPRCLA